MRMKEYLLHKHRLEAGRYGRLEARRYKNGQAMKRNRISPRTTPSCVAVPKSG